MEIIFPENLRCISCNDHIDTKNPYSLCKSCYKELGKDTKICRKCGRILGETGICFGCEREKYYFDEVYSVFKYNDILHHIIYEFKYGQGTYLAKYLGEIMSDYIKTYQLSFDYILFVPIGKKRFKERGYNQAKLLAQEISDNLNIPIIDCFKRKINTKFLAKLTGIERKREIEGAFEIADNQSLDFLEEKKVIIVDDIFTTGFTVNELAKVLKNCITVEKTMVLTLGNAKTKK